MRPTQQTLAMNIPSSSIPRSPSAPVKDWTLLYVLDGDNDLREAATLDMVGLDRQGAPENVHVAAQLYRGELQWGWKTLGKKLSSLTQPKDKPAVAPDWRGMRVFETRRREDATSVTRQVSYTPDSEAAANSAKSLEEFLVWGMTNYPAKNFAIILAGHGAPDGILPDGRGEMMGMTDAADAIRGAGQKVGQKPGLVVLDACSTANPETVRAFQGSADYLVASPEKIRGGGWSESHTLDALANNSRLKPRSLAESFLSEAHTAIPSAHLYNLTDGTLESSR